MWFKQKKKGWRRGPLPTAKSHPSKGTLWCRKISKVPPHSKVARGDFAERFFSWVVGEGKILGNHLGFSVFSNTQKIFRLRRPKTLLKCGGSPKKKYVTPPPHERIKLWSTIWQKRCPRQKNTISLLATASINPILKGYSHLLGVYILKDQGDPHLWKSFISSKFFLHSLIFFVSFEQLHFFRSFFDICFEFFGSSMVFLKIYNGRLF